MDKQDGGQASSASWNRWRDDQTNTQDANNGQGVVVANNVSNTGAEQRQHTATELARKKVLEAYKTQLQDYRAPSEASPVPKVNAEDWRKYHSAWQDYYQKYYGEYYGKAAREYVAQERMKYEREQAEKARKAAADESLLTTAAATNAETDKDVKQAFREKIRKKAENRASRFRRSRHFIPVIIGIVVLIAGLLFQYNQVIIANAVAYMSPGSSEVNGITAVDPTVTVAVHDSPTLMVPKLNIEVPVVFGAANDLNSMAKAMYNGVAHFSVPGASAVPGEIGNFAISGHSAGNVYQKSDYKFIFSGLTRMAEGDLIYMDYNGTRYTYRVLGTKTVEPTDVASLSQIASDNSGKPMITLITCTPLGTSKYRLLVYGEQIYPSYENASTSAPTTTDDSSKTVEMPSNQASPLEQFWNWLTGKDQE